MAYDVDSDDLIARYDARDVCDLASDTGSPVLLADLSANAKVAAARDDALGDVESALVAGQRYTVAQLEGLTGTALAHFKRLVCGRTMYYLLCRRPAFDPDRLKAFDEWTETQLKRLRLGENVFNLDDQKDAGVIDHEFIEAADVSKIKLLRDRVQNTYPRRVYPEN